MLLRSDKTTRISAEAAALSAKAAIAIELPIIRATPGKFGYGDTVKNGEGQRYVWISSIRFANIGKTKAFPVELQFGHTFGNALRATPIYPLKKPFPINVAIIDTEYDFSLTEFSFEVPLDIYDRLRDQSEDLWFYCNLVYLDFMETRHETAFCWRRYETFGMGGLTVDRTPAYNKKT
jgi:hypothetical protein